MAYREKYAPHDLAKKITRALYDSPEEVERAELFDGTLAQRLEHLRKHDVCRYQEFEEMYAQFEQFNHFAHRGLEQKALPGTTSDGKYYPAERLAGESLDDVVAIVKNEEISSVPMLADTIAASGVLSDEEAASGFEYYLGLSNVSVNGIGTLAAAFLTKRGEGRSLRNKLVQWGAYAAGSIYSAVAISAVGAPTWLAAVPIFNMLATMYVGWERQQESNHLKLLKSYQATHTQLKSAVSDVMGDEQLALMAP